ncbi:MAG: DUF1761 domain-containing protein [Candidatus Acidiferrales bacterium]
MKVKIFPVIVCAIAYWLLGWLWFDVLFGKKWMALEGFTQAQVQNQNAAKLIVVTVLLSLLIAYVLANLCAWRNANTAGRGAAIGVLLWIGFVGPISYTTFMYEGRSLVLYGLDYLYPLVGLCMMGAILGVWNRKAA